jgi:hypothetical protein
MEIKFLAIISLVFCSSFSLSSELIKEYCGITFESIEKKTACLLPVHYVYVHEKFCNKLSFYYTIEKKMLQNDEYVVMNILLSSFNGEDLELLDNTDRLVNFWQWHCSLLNDKNDMLLPTKIEKKNIKQEDFCVFGRHLSFGVLYEVLFKINKDDKNKKCFLFAMEQCDKKIYVDIEV